MKFDEQFTLRLGAALKGTLPGEGNAIPDGAFLYCPHLTQQEIKGYNPRLGGYCCFYT